jgi:predicted Rossmann-fold nucleotide-binding protein
MEVVPEQAERLQKVAALADAFVALPGSLASAAALFGAWTASKAMGKTCPVVMLNRHRAFEAMRGYAADVLSPGLKGYERSVQFSDSIEDLWSRVSRLVSEGR